MAVSPTSPETCAVRTLVPASHAFLQHNVRHAKVTLPAKTANTVRMELTAVTVTKHAMKIDDWTAIISFKMFWQFLVSILLRTTERNHV